MTNWIKYVITVHTVSFHSTLKTNVEFAVVNLDSKSVLEELRLLLRMGIGDNRTLVKKFTNAIIRTVLLRRKSTSCMMATIFVEKDILELVVKVAIIMECFGVTIIFRRASVAVANATL